jgi:DNA polymerase elongation subunit (family B)
LTDLVRLQRVFRPSCMYSKYAKLLVDFRTKQPGKIQDYVEHMVDLREYDVPYHVRFAIDNGESR